MESKSNIKNHYICAFIAFYLVTFLLEVKAQDPGLTNISEFSITVEKTQDGFKMYSSEGSAWKELNFRLHDGKLQAINQFGMTQMNEVPENSSLNLADYLFTIAKTKTGVELIGHKGTAWKKLSFPLVQNRKQTINQLGMTN